jgi:hypothetical protein
MVEYSRMPVPSLSSGCEIAQFLFAKWMLSSSCDSEVEFYMHITIEARLACTLFDTAGMHALFDMVDPS